MLWQQLILFCFLRFVPLLEAIPGRTCILYETYQTVSYGMEYSHDRFSQWLSNRNHRVPRKYSRMGIRSKLGICCTPGYTASKSTSTCEPVCYVTCEQNEHCAAPNLCVCNEGFRRVGYGSFLGPHCVPSVTSAAPSTTTTTLATTTTSTPITTTTMATTSTPIPTKTTTTTTPTTSTTTTTLPTTSTTTATTTPSTPPPTTPSKTPPTTQPTPTSTSIITTPVQRESAAIAQSCSGPCAANEICSGDACVCKEGYEISVRNGTSKCESKCEPACQHADCVGPQSCACWPGYLRTNATACHQPCSKQTCVFGECSENGTCVCLPRFRSNGNECIWADDAILSEPQSCDCWLRVNSTEVQCLLSCDHTTEPSTTDCINVTVCQYSGVMLSCQNELYTCSAIRNSSPTDAADETTPDQEMTGKLAEDSNESSGKMTLLIVGFIAFILAVGLCTYIWLKYGHRFASSASYNHMPEAEGL